MKREIMGNSLVVAGGPEMVERVRDLLKREGILKNADPDAYVRTFRHFGVEEARTLAARAALKALGGGRRVFIIAAPDINREAQNALLKTLEEPSGDALFILIVPSPEMLLPTLRSRLQILVLADFVSPKDLRSPNIRILEFLKATPQKRLDLLKPLLEKGDDDPEADAPRRNGAGKRDLGRIISFLVALEQQLAKEPEGVRAVYRARKYITDRGALVKPLLEQVALLVPRV